MKWLLVAALLALPRPAPACTCATTPLSVFPADGAIDVPTNTLLLVLGAEPMATVRLVGPNQSEVALTPELLFSDGTTLSRSYQHAPLVALGQYRVLVNDAQVASFQTDTAADEVPPPAPMLDHLWLATAMVNAPASCGPELAEVDFTLVPDQATELYDVEIVGEDGSKHYVVPPMQVVNLGDGGCQLEAGLEAGEMVCVRLTAIDRAGNRSATDERCSQVIQCDPVDDGAPLPSSCGAAPADEAGDGCGCRVGGRAPAGGLLLLGLLLSLRLVRRTWR